MDQEEKRFIDYFADKVIVDQHFQYSILSKIAIVGYSLAKSHRACRELTLRSQELMPRIFPYGKHSVLHEIFFSMR
jgi:hypothetical protein